VKIALGVFQGGGVSVLALAAKKKIGIKSGFERQHLDVEFFFDQKTECALGGFCAGSVGIEIDDDIFAEAAQEFCLQFSESRTGAGDDVLESGGVHGDTVHLAFDKDGIVEFANGFLRVVEVEEDF